MKQLNNAENVISFIHVLPKATLIHARHPFIVDRCKGKRVLHIGCVDVGLMEKRFKQNELLHQKLQEVTSLLYGVDINKEGISFLQEKGLDNLFVIDISGDIECNVLSEVEFDIIILSEVVEHLSNPGLMLEAVQKFMNDKTILIVSVPNAFSTTNILNMLKGMEFVHPDHNYYFSYVTFNNILKKSNLFVKSFYVYSFNHYVSDSNHSIFKKFYWDLVRSYQAETKPFAFRSFFLGIGKWVKNILEVIVVKFFYNRTGFFGDGLLVECKLLKVQEKTIGP